MCFEPMVFISPNIHTTQMPVHAFSRNTSTSAVEYLGLSSNVLPETKRNQYIFFASLTGKPDIPLVKTLLSNVYMEPAKVIQARKLLEALISQKTSSTMNHYITFSIWFCFPLHLPKSSSVKMNYTHESILQHELLITNQDMDETFINHIITQMAQNGCPIFVSKTNDGKMVEDTLGNVKKSIYLAFTPT